MSEVGHNLPPDMTVTVGEVAKDLSDWMSEHPVIDNEDDAREAKVLIDRASLGIKDLEDERTQKVSPLNEAVKQINDKYRGPREALSRVLGVLKNRIGEYLHETETTRIKAAAEAARVAQEAEEAAREAERQEHQVIEAAAHGELGLSIATATGDADAAFAAYQRAERKAALAEKETKVRIGGGFTRALGLRERDILRVEDPIAVIMEVGLTADIEDAMIKSARAFKKLRGRWPLGVKVATTRKV